MDMDQKALELYLYIGSTEPVVKWLKEQNCKTREQAIDLLRPMVRSNAMSVFGAIGRGEYGGSLAGTSNAVEKILKEFPEEKKS